MYDYDNEYEIGYHDDYQDFEDNCAWEDSMADMNDCEGDFDGNYTNEDYDYSDYVESEDFSDFSEDS